jgi:hypothetical protein
MINLHIYVERISSWVCDEWVLKFNTYLAWSKPSNPISEMHKHTNIASRATAFCAETAS